MNKIGLIGNSHAALLLTQHVQVESEPDIIVVEDGTATIEDIKYNNIAAHMEVPVINYRSHLDEKPDYKQPKHHNRSYGDSIKKRKHKRRISNSTKRKNRK